MVEWAGECLCKVNQLLFLKIKDSLSKFCAVTFPAPAHTIHCQHCPWLGNPLASSYCYPKNVMNGILILDFCKRNFLGLDNNFVLRCSSILQKQPELFSSKDAIYKKQIVLTGPHKVFTDFASVLPALVRLCRTELMQISVLSKPLRINWRIISCLMCCWSYINWRAMSSFLADSSRNFAAVSGFRAFDVWPLLGSHPCLYTRTRQSTQFVVIFIIFARMAWSCRFIVNISISA